MTAWLIIGGVLCGWALLATLGGERQRRLMELQAQAECEAAQAAQAQEEVLTVSEASRKPGKMN